MANHYVRCKICGRHKDETGYVSARGLCVECRWVKYRKWVEAMEAAERAELERSPDATHTG